MLKLILCDIKRLVIIILACIGLAVKFVRDNWTHGDTIFAIKGVGCLSLGYILVVLILVNNPNP